MPMQILLGHIVFTSAVERVTVLAGYIILSWKLQKTMEKEEEKDEVLNKVGTTDK